MCVIEESPLLVNYDGTVTIFCYCGWMDTHPTQEAAHVAGRAHMEDFEEMERLYDEDRAAWSARYDFDAQ